MASSLPSPPVAKESVQADQLSYEHVPFKVVRTFRVRLVEAGRLGPRVVEPFVDESEG